MRSFDGRWLACLASPLVLAAAPACAAAQDARPFEIPAGPLDQGLSLYAVQGDQQLLYAPDVADGRRTAGVNGRLSPRAALERLLRDTGLSAQETRPGVWVIQRQASNPIAQATTVDEIVVTGSLIRGASDGASPLVTLDRDAMDQRGYGTVADALRNLPQSHGATASPTTSVTGRDRLGTNRSQASSVNLRGLGADATLVLVNGRRMAGAGSRGDITDISSIPATAIERVDVLLDGASAIYGSDAVAGVVNLILRSDFDGAETRFSAGAASGGAEEIIAGQTFGRRWDSGSALIAYEVHRQNPLSISDRPYTADADLRPFGGSDHRTFYSAPGNIVRFDPTRGGYTTLWAIQPGASGPGFDATDVNLATARLGTDLVPRHDRQAVYAVARQSLGGRVDALLDFRWSQRDFESSGQPASSVLTVSSANPHFASPSGAASHQIAYSFARELGPVLNEGRARSLGATAGFDARLSDSWSLEAYLAYAEQSGQTRASRMVHSSALAEALGNAPDNPDTAYSAIRDGYFNPFGEGSANNRTILDYIGSAWQSSQDFSRTSSANLLINGELFSLPGGTIRVAFGAQHRQEHFSQSSRSFTSGVTPVSSVRPDADRSMSAVFAETRIPIFGAANARPGLEWLELSAALRHEDYEGMGATTNPKLGVVWEPALGVRARATYGTSFRAPSLIETSDAPLQNAVPLPAGGYSVLSILLYGGNPDLEPETATTWTFGVDIDRERLWGWRASLTHFDTEFENRIARPAFENVAGVLINPAYAPFVQWIDPSRPEDRARVEAILNSPTFIQSGSYPLDAYGAIVDARYVNAASLRVRGIDLSLGRDWSLNDHTFDLNLSATYMDAYDRRLTPTSDAESLAGLTTHPPRWRATAHAGWRLGPWSANLGLYYTDGHTDPNNRGVSSWTTADMQVRWTGQGGGWSDQLSVALNVRNLLDRDPPFFDGPQGLGFDPTSANALGRVIGLQLTKGW